MEINRRTQTGAGGIPSQQSSASPGQSDPDDVAAFEKAMQEDAKADQSDGAGQDDVRDLIRKQTVRQIIQQSKEQTDEIKKDLEE